MKKNLILSIVALGAIVFFAECSDDDKKKPNRVNGSWLVTDAAGVEWEEGTGIINTNDPDEEFIDATFTITATEITLGTMGTFDYEFSNDVFSISIGGDTEVFNVEFDGSGTMYWTQDEPDEHSDYEENNPGQFLYYQKSFTLEKQ